ncbi:cytochrome c biogenesis protein CcsA [Telmatocola sphagniphila]|jgi:ABC-type transport system involved in cytochrome c biogenesis permease subunit|uniref:Cytochrome c biogenesis protein CcsA n=1 Tax=Telmatocola sphagniphila TaxID=1123043 RepID=A0A8E6B8F0_9BACT|nr:cytochrome c biogenesis protein CcsA [Telmatocola sphagniphila]QVL32433.1 cytochrome c biogenesis protein CcsA [Telmatocola sphagniphila]
MDGIDHLCFNFSYLAVFLLELAQLIWPKKGLRIATLVFAFAGLLAHTLFLAFKQPTPAMPYGSLLLLGWVFAIFYLYGSLHKGSRAWAVFFLPMVLILVWVAWFVFRDENKGGTWFSGHHFWGMFHGGLLLAASVCIMFGFVTSSMYLIQARRLREKRNPLTGMKLLSLETLERINRRSINIAFPLLTIGLLLGIIRAEKAEAPETPWTAFKILGSFGLWVVATLLMIARYRASLPARKLAWLTIAVFVLVIVTLFASHPFVASGGVQ